MNIQLPITGNLGGNGKNGLSSDGNSSGTSGDSFASVLGFSVDAPVSAAGAAPTRDSGSLSPDGNGTSGHFASASGFSVDTPVNDAAAAAMQSPEGLLQASEGWAGFLDRFAGFPDSQALEADGEDPLASMDRDAATTEKPETAMEALPVDPGVGLAPLPPPMLLPDGQHGHAIQAGGPGGSPFHQGLPHLMALAMENAERLPPGDQDITDGPDGNALPSSGKALPLADFFAQAQSDLQSTGDPFATPGQNPGSAATAADAGTTLSPAALNALQQALAAAPREARPASETQPGSTPTLQWQSPFVAGSDAWAQDLGTRIEWLQHAKMNRAELYLHPAELGALEIRISSEDDVTRVSFITQTAGARDLIEQQMPRLRELLAGQGLQLEQGSVSQQSPDERHQGQGVDQQSSAGRNHDDAGNTDTDTQARSHRTVAAGRIDHYV